MTRLIRYVLAEFIRPFVFSAGVLVVLILVAELFEHIDKFLASEVGFLRIAHYLLNLLPMRMLEVMPVAVLLATLFALGNLSRRGEIIAAMSGGVHPWTLVRGLLGFGVLLSAVSWAVSDLVVPKSAAEAQAVWKTDVRRMAALRRSEFDNVTAAGKNGVYYAVGLLDTDDNTMERVVVDWYERGRLVRQVQAMKGAWSEKGWTLTNGVERRYDRSGTGLASQEAFKSRLFGLADPPSSLVPDEREPAEMSYRAYNDELRRKRSLGIPTRKEEVDLHMKLAFPWTNLIVLILGIPFAFSKRGGTALAVGFALAVAFFYFGLMEVGRAMGQKPWCPPLLGAWLANLVFIAIGAWRFWRLPRLG